MWRILHFKIQDISKTAKSKTAYRQQCYNARTFDGFDIVKWTNPTVPVKIWPNCMVDVTLCHLFVQSQLKTMTLHSFQGIVQIVLMNAKQLCISLEILSLCCIALLELYMIYLMCC